MELKINKKSSWTQLLRQKLTYILMEVMSQFRMHSTELPFHFVFMNNNTKLIYLQLETIMLQQTGKLIAQVLNTVRPVDSRFDCESVSNGATASASANSTTKLFYQVLKQVSSA